FVADQFEDGDFGAVTDANTGRDDAGVATGAIGVLWRDFTEELLGDAGSEDVAGGLTARGQGVALTERDELFGNRTRGLGAGQRGGDAAVLEEVGDQVAQGGTTVPGVAPKFGAGFQVS